MAVSVTKGNVATGSRVKLQIQGTDIGYATIASYVETISYDPVAVLDQLEIAEHVPVAYDVAFTASRVFLLNESLKNAGLNIFPQFGTNSASFLTNIENLGELSATIIDDQAQEIVQLVGVRVTSHNLTFGARAVVGEDISFVAIRAIDRLAGES
jgi:hypothetical protein